MVAHGSDARWASAPRFAPSLSFIASLVLPLVGATACSVDGPPTTTFAAALGEGNALSVAARLTSLLRRSAGDRASVSLRVTSARPPTSTALWLVERGHASPLATLLPADFTREGSTYAASYAFTRDVPPGIRAWKVCAGEPRPSPAQPRNACDEVSLVVRRRDIGCADGSREGFADLAQYPNIAGCSGAWDVPGILDFNPGAAPSCPGLATYDTTRPTCARASGNDGANPLGVGCTVEDLCDRGWHVCRSAGDVAASSPAKGCAEVAQADDPPLFFATRQSGTGHGHCATGTRVGAECNAVDGLLDCAPSPALSNDVFGCGNWGTHSWSPSCAPLNRFSDDHCVGFEPSVWYPCMSPAGLCEAYTIIKRGPDHGGVLCCRDAKPGRGHGDGGACDGDEGRETDD